MDHFRQDESDSDSDVGNTRKASRQSIDTLVREIIQESIQICNKNLEFEVEWENMLLHVNKNA